MTQEMIEKFVENKSRKDASVNIHFKGRDTVTGMFLHLADYDELKAKNFWRIVTGGAVQEWLKTKDTGLARIFNGVSFTRLTDERLS
jgi:hypothetical protein